MNLDTVVEDNMGFVVRMAQKLAITPSVEMDDLIQEGCVGLLLARDRFDENKGIKFLTYAYHWIRARMEVCIFESRLIQIPRYKTENKKLREKLGDLSRTTSMESLITANEDLSLQDLLGYRDAEFERLEDRHEIFAIFDFLNDYDRCLIKHRYAEDLNFRQIGARYNMSHETARQHVNKAVVKIIEHRNSTASE